VKKITLLLALFTCFASNAKGGLSVPKASDFFSVSDLKPGLTGVGYTVFSSQKGLETFGVKILGTMQNVLGPNKDLIIAELSGPRFQDRRQVVAGMSGSPVYIDGKLLGAVGYGFGSFTHVPIAGITPIRDMLQANQPNLKETSLAAHPDFGQLAPLALPLMVQGMPSQNFNEFSEELKKRGYGSLMQGAGTGSSSGDKIPLFAGGPLAIPLISGAMTMASIGTVSYVKDNLFLGFGHPFLASGVSALPIFNAEIVTTIFSNRYAYKLGQATTPIGVLTNDRLSAITGEMGKTAKTIPMDVHFEGSFWHYELAKHKTDTPLFASIALLNTLSRRVERELGGTFQIDMTSQISSGQIFSLTRHLAGYQKALERPLARTLLRELTLMLQKDLEDISLSSLKVHIKRNPSVKVKKLVGLNIYGAFKPGKKSQIDILLKPWQKPIESRRVQLSVPTTLSQDKVELIAVDRENYVKFMKEAGQWTKHTNVSDHIKQLASRPSDSDVCFFVRESELAPRKIGRALTGLPLSYQNTLSNAFSVIGEKKAQKIHFLSCERFDGLFLGRAEGNVQVIRE